MPERVSHHFEGGPQDRDLLFIQFAVAGLTLAFGKWGSDQRGGGGVEFAVIDAPPEKPL